METRTLNLESHPEPVELLIESESLSESHAGKPYSYTASHKNTGPTIKPSARIQPVYFTLNRISYKLETYFQPSYWSSPDGTSGWKMRHAGRWYFERVNDDGSRISTWDQKDPTSAAYSHAHDILREIEAWMNDRLDELQTIAAADAAESCRARADEMQETVKEWRKLADVIETSASQEVTR